MNGCSKLMHNFDEGFYPLQMSTAVFGGSEDVQFWGSFCVYSFESHLFL